LQGAQRVVNGMAVLCGREVQTGRITAFELQPWRLVRTVFNPETGEISGGVGLASWMVSIWARYRCDLFYVRERDPGFVMFATQLRDVEELRPRPRIGRVDWDDRDEEAETWLYQLRAREELLLHPELAKLMDERTSAAGEPSVARQAVMAAVMGFKRRPWRDPGEKAVQTILIG
jgi:hypothetical protein